MTTATSVPGNGELSHLTALADRSLDVILAHQDVSGAYPASPTFSAYRGYSWFRDGAFIADGVSAYGEVESASRFHDWCAGVLTSRADQIADIVRAADAGKPVPAERMLPTRFTLGGAEGDDQWWDFQLDGYGTWLWSVAEHSARHNLEIDRWNSGVLLAVDYLLSSWQRPCFDWWEENPDEVHVSTLGCIAAGLRAVTPYMDVERAGNASEVVAEILKLIADRGTAEGHLTKWLGSTTVDASLVSLMSPLGLIAADSSVGSTTIATIDETLAPGGGVHRYAADTFYGGGQWPLLSCMLGLAFAAAGDRERAHAQLQWAAGTATSESTMPEQVSDHLLAPHMRQEWIDRWGPVATPLLWSHGMFLRLAAELGIGGRS